MKPFVKGDKFLTFIIYAGKVTQILYHQFTWVSSQTDSSVISHLSRLRTTHFLRQYFKKNASGILFVRMKTSLIWLCFSWERYFFFPFFFDWFYYLFLYIYSIPFPGFARHVIRFCLLVIGLITKKKSYIRKVPNDLR